MEKYQAIESYWSSDADEIFLKLGSRRSGLTTDEASHQRKIFGNNELIQRQRFPRLFIFLNQIKSHLLLILVIAAFVSILSGEWLDATLIIAILVGSAGIGYSRELSAYKAIDELKKRIQIKITTFRDGAEISINTKDLVPGDVVRLSAGSIVPSDCRIIECRDLFVNEAILTGESYPVEKHSLKISPHLSLNERNNCVFMGSNIRSGTALCLVVNTGFRTEYNKIAKRLSFKPPETEFEMGIRKFGDFLTASMLVMTALVFAVNLSQKKPALESLLFSIALAVGLSPELLPAILKVNLSQASKNMAKRGVIVRNLNALENLGSMTVLCTDKTGTLTEGVIAVEGAYSWDGKPSEDVLELARINSGLQTGLSNPLDEAVIVSGGKASLPRKHSEIPYDFVRKRMSVIYTDSNGVNRMVSKGASSSITQICRFVKGAGVMTDSLRALVQGQVERWGSEGIRVLAVASKYLPKKNKYTKDDETELELDGFITFKDKIKENVALVIKELRDLGVDIKIITGDSKLVAQHVARSVGVFTGKSITGLELDEIRDEALLRSSIDISIFAEVDPNQKERIILALRKTGAVVGFLGDGVNDAPAMHAADTSIAVDSATDVAREVADFVILDRNLDVVRSGIEEGRRTFANTLKYILITMSANLGNMLTMAISSVFIPFLPLLPGQVLLNNFLSDIPSVGLATDAVDKEIVSRPQRWNMQFIRSAMLKFGLISSAFDLITFAILLKIFSVGVKEFRTSWFVESLLTELLVAVILRTNKPFWQSKPGLLFGVLTLLTTAVGFVSPFLPFSSVFGFVTIPTQLMLFIVTIALFYILTTEALKFRILATR